jgi:hypothetical protein
VIKQVKFLYIKDITNTETNKIHVSASVFLLSAAEFRHRSAEGTPVGHKKRPHYPAVQHI